MNGISKSYIYNLFNLEISLIDSQGKRYDGEIRESGSRQVLEGCDNEGVFVPSYIKNVADNFRLNTPEQAKGIYEPEFYTLCKEGIIHRVNFSLQIGRNSWNLEKLAFNEWVMLGKPEKIKFTKIFEPQI